MARLSVIQSILLCTAVLTEEASIASALPHQVTPSRADLLNRSRFLAYAAASSLASCLALPSQPLSAEATAYAFPSRGGDGESRHAGSNMDVKSATQPTGENGSIDPKRLVAYRSLLMDMPGYGVNVPVAMWYPVGVEASAKEKEDFGYTADETFASERSTERMMMDYPDVVVSKSAVVDEPTRKTGTATYFHRISVKKIGQLLAGWDFIPEFLSRDFRLTPTMNQLGIGKGVADFVVDGEKVELPKSGPVVFLAHGYLGSRFDLSHMAEELAKEGFICLCPEYPESLASSYPRTNGLTREQITNRLIRVVESDLAIAPTSRGIVGHSLGCGTAVATGDSTCVRVCIAGFPSMVDGPALFLSSVNDGAVSSGRIRGALSGYVELTEGAVRGDPTSPLPRRAALIFDRDDAPNHISYLAGSTNDAMITLLSPLLPIAQALSIQVLDFDKYQASRDSKQTADIVVPLVSSFLKQYMQ